MIGPSNNDAGGQETRAKADGERRHRRYSGRVVGRVSYNYRPISILLQFYK